MLVGSPKGPDQVVGLIKNLGLPFQADETFIGKNGTERKVLKERLGYQPLIKIGRN
jgi:hypothetical protein